MTNNQPERSVEEIVEEFIEELIKSDDLGWAPTHDTIRKRLKPRLTQTLQAERTKREEMVEVVAQRAFHEGCSSGMDEYGTQRGGKLWHETKTYQSITQPPTPLTSDKE